MALKLTDLVLKKAYSSDQDDIVNDFYIPALEASTRYQRLAGFFSSSGLAVAARGVGVTCPHSRYQSLS